MHQIVHLAEELSGFIRLGDEAPVIRKSPRGWAPFGGRNDQQDVGRTGVDLASQIHAVERPWHLNISEEQPDILPLFDTLSVRRHSRLC